MLKRTEPRPARPWSWRLAAPARPWRQTAPTTRRATIRNIVTATTRASTITMGQSGDHGGQPGDDHGGKTEPGDDNGGPGEEPGDDNGGTPATEPGGRAAPAAPGGGYSAGQRPLS